MIKSLRRFALTGLVTAFIGAACSLPAFAATPVITYTINGVHSTTYGTRVTIHSPTKITWIVNNQPITASTPSPSPTKITWIVNNQPITASTPSPSSPQQYTPTPAPAPAAANSTALPAGLTPEEQQMVTLVNQERVKSGVKPLQVDMRLVKVGRMKSQDMIDNHYFDHTSAKYGSPFDLMRAQGITFRAAGENIAGNWSVQSAHTSLMNSPGHRSNILSPNYTSIGIGIIKGGPYGLMISQEFIG